MAELSKRKLKLQVDDIEIEAITGSLGLRVAFDVQRDKESHPNQCSVSIWNLNPDHRKSLTKQKEVTVSIEAGYEDTIQQIFFGTLRRATTSREPPDHVTKLELGDGQKEMAVATISKTFTKGTPVAKVLKDLAGTVGLGIGNVPQFLASAKLSNGKILSQPLTVVGSVSEELPAFCRSLGLSFSIQSGAIQLLDLANPVLPGTATVISQGTGMIGEARLDIDRETKKPICVVRSLLQPQLVPGALFVVESENVSGSYAVRRSRHYGDTHTKDWYVDVEGVEIG